MDPGKSLPSLDDCVSDGKETHVYIPAENSEILVKEVIGPMNDKLNNVQIVAPKAALNVVYTPAQKTPKCTVRIATPVGPKAATTALDSGAQVVGGDKLNKVQIVAPKIAQNVPTSANKTPKCTVKIAAPVAPIIATTASNSVDQVVKPINDTLNQVQIVAPKIAQNVPTSANKTPKCTVKIAAPVAQIIATTASNSVDQVVKPINDTLNQVQIVAPNVSNAEKTPRTIKIAIPIPQKTTTTLSNSGGQVITGNPVLTGGPYIVSIPPNPKTPNTSLPVLVTLPPGIHKNENGQLVLQPGSNALSGLKMVPTTSGAPTLMNIGENGQYFVAINPTSSGAVSVNVTPSLTTEKGIVVPNSSNVLTPSNALTAAKPIIKKTAKPATEKSTNLTSTATIKKPTNSNDKSPTKSNCKKTPKNKKNWASVGGIKLSNLKAKLFKNNTDKQLMNSYLCLEKSYLKTNKISKMRFERLKKLKAHYKSTLNKITDLCASINFAAENVEALIPYNSAKRQGCHRWSFDERIMAISLLRKSPVSYQILRPVFNLPSRKCLRYSLDKQNCRAGVNKFIFNTLKNFLVKLDPLDRICCLSFDQMEIKVHTQFDSHFDKIHGLVDLGFQQGRSKLCGDHALVFELKSLRKKWSMPIAYFCTNGEIQSQTLRRLVLRIIGECQAIGVDIMSTSCPMYDNFRAGMKLLGSDKDKPMFEFQEKIISTIYDPAHLLVLSRDELYKNNIGMNICIDGEAEMLAASWNHIEQAYESDSKNTFPKLHKIKKTDLDPPIGLRSINIKQAARCLSNSMASVINQQVVTGLFNKETLATAHYVGKLNETFDSLNGASTRAKGARGLKCQIEKKKEDLHIDFWLSTSRDIETWMFSDNTHIPDGWITTLRGVLALWKNLKEKGFTNLELKQFSNDSLRSMFKGMKSFYKTSMLNFTQFEEAFKNCANNYLININGGMDPYAFNNHKLFTSPLKGCSNKEPRKLKHEKAFKKHNLQFSKNFLKCFSLCNIVKTIASLLSHKIKCSKCLSVLFDASGLPDEGFVIKSNEKDLYLSQNLIQSVSSCINDYEACMPKHMHKDRISLAVPEELLKKFNNVWLKQACSTHFKAVSKDIVHMTFESMSIWWGRKLAKDHDQLIAPVIAKKRVRNKPSKKTPKKPKVSYFINDKFIDESHIEETIIDFHSPSKYNILNMPDF